MLEQELKPETRPRRNLRETERKRVTRNRFLVAGVLLSLALVGGSAIKRTLPQWIEMPGSKQIGTTQEKLPVPGTGGSAFTTSASARVSHPAIHSLPLKTIRPDAAIKSARRSAASLKFLDPEILPVEESAAPRRRKHRKRSTSSIKAPSSAAPPPAKHAETDTPSPNPAESSHAEPNSKPPDDVPDNP